MSMPIITSSGVERCDAITDIIESVALQQTGLSHILNAEGEKIQAILKYSQDPEKILEVNESVESMVNSITRLEVILQGKLELFKTCLCKECDEKTGESTLEITSVNPAGGELIMESDTTYVYVPGDEKNELVFTTDPETTVELISELPDGAVYSNGVLTLTEKIDWTINYEISFLVGSGEDAYIVTIYTKSID